MRHNLILEFESSKPELLDKLENTAKSNELFLAEWGREGDKIRILSEFGEIKSMLFKDFSQDELKKLPYKIIPFEEELK